MDLPGSRRRLRPHRVPVAAALALVAAAGGCSSGAPASTGGTVPVQPVAHELRTPDQVEALVRDFGDCVVNRVPTGAAFAVWFDPGTGLVGTTRMATADDDTGRQLAIALFQCDAELAYRPSINAYTEANALGGRLGPNGLPPDRGEQLFFGDQVLARSLAEPRPASG